MIATVKKSFCKQLVCPSEKPIILKKYISDGSVPHVVKYTNGGALCNPVEGSILTLGEEILVVSLNLMATYMYLAV